MPPSRRELLKRGAQLGTAGAIVSVAGCGGQSPEQITANTTTAGDSTMPPDSPPVDSSPALPDEFPTTEAPQPAPLVRDYPTVTPLPFAHGVASGDPLADRVIIWTRITEETPSASSITVGWVIGTGFVDNGNGPEITGVVGSGSQSTSADRDWTVKVDATGLSPATNYYYQFAALGRRSVIGRTRTAPNTAVDDIRVAVVSCSSYWSSFWSGYDNLANRNDLDLVVHCGDYIYDFVDGDEEVRTRPNAPADINHVDYRDWLNIDEVRRRYALFRSDPALCRAHQQHPWTIIWDNHDIDPGFGNELDDSSVDRSGETTTITDTVRAFYEWTPTRPPLADGSGNFLLVNDGSYPTPPDPRLHWRKLDYGPLLDIFTLETQLYLREPADNSHMANGEDSLFSSDQYNWLTSQTLASANAGKTWRLFVNQTWLAPWQVPETVPGFTPDTPVQNRWFDYPEERAQLFQFWRDNGISNNIVVSGDMHGNWASDLIEDNAPANSYTPGAVIQNTRTGSRPLNTNAGYKRGPSNPTPALNRSMSVGVEFAPTSMGRGGADELEANANPGSNEASQIAAARALENASINGNKNVQFKEWVDHGYGIVHMTADRALFEFWWQDKLTPNSPDVLGFKMVCWAAADGSAIPPRRQNEIDDVFLHNLPYDETSSTRTDATPAPEGSLNPA